MRHKPLLLRTLSAVFLWLLVGAHSPRGQSNRVQAIQESQPEEPEEHGADSAETSPQGSWSHWWSYDGISGPGYWNINKRWQICSRGREQSPVELRTDLLVYDYLLGPFRLAWHKADAAASELPVLEPQENSIEPSKRPKEVKLNNGDKHKGPHSSIRMELLNTGRGLELSLLEEHPANAGHQLLLSEGPLSYSYRLFRLELHASESIDSKRSPTNGPSTTSEHLINGRWFDGELQLHFYNHQLASSSLRAARMAERGSAPANLFAAIAVFIRATESTHQPSPLDSLLEQVSKVPNRANRLELHMDPSQLESLVPNRHQYITYHGSQNRPPCAEGLQWILVNQALRVDAAKFRLLFQQTSTSQDNVRPIQALNGRLLRTTIDWRAALSGPSNCQPGPNSTSVKSYCNPQPSTTSNATSSPEEQMATRPRISLEELVPKPGRLGCSMKPNYGYQLSSLA